MNNTKKTANLICPAVRLESAVKIIPAPDELVCPVTRLKSAVKRLPPRKDLICPVRRPFPSEQNLYTENFSSALPKSNLQTTGSIMPAPQSPASLSVQNQNVGPEIMTRRQTRVRDITFTEVGSTIAWAKGTDVLLFDGTLIIEKKIRHLDEVYDQHGKVVKLNTSVSFQIKLSVSDFFFRGIVSLEELRSGTFFDKLSEGEVVLEKEKDVPKLYRLFVTEKIRAKDYPTETIFATTGWKELPEQLGLCYVLPDGVVGYPDLNISAQKNHVFGVCGKPYYGKSIAKDFLAMRSILPEKQSVVIFFQYYLLVGLLRGFLRSVDICPKFVLAVIGETNSKKTPLANLFFKLYDRERGADINFKATKVALEEALAENADAVTIIDDITPPGNRTDDREQRSKLEMIIRSFGDNLPRKRSKAYVHANPGVSEFTPVLTTAVITGENFPVSLASSRTRIVKVELGRNDCNLTELTRQQQKLEVLPTFALAFIDYVARNQKAVSQQVAACFNSKRYQNPLALKTPRFVETFALLDSLTEVFKSFLIATGEFACAEVETLISYDRSALAKVMLENDAEATVRPDEVLVSEAVLNAFTTQNYQDKSFDPLNSITVKADCLIIHPSYLCKLVSTYYGNLGKVFPWATVPEFSKFLASKEMIKTSTESGKNHRTLKASFNGEVQGQRYYYLIKTKLEALAESGSL